VFSMIVRGDTCTSSKPLVAERSSCIATSMLASPAPMTTSPSADPMERGPAPALLLLAVMTVWEVVGVDWTEDFVDVEGACDRTVAEETATVVAHEAAC